LINSVKIGIPKLEKAKQKNKTNKKQKNKKQKNKTNKKFAEERGGLSY